MPLYELEVETTGREVYRVDAESGEYARYLFESGRILRPVVSEVLSAEVVNVKEISP